MNEDKYSNYLTSDAEDKAIERYIERRRKEFEKEWLQYISEDMTREELNYYLFNIIR